MLSSLMEIPWVTNHPPICCHMFAGQYRRRTAPREPFGSRPLFAGGSTQAPRGQRRTSPCVYQRRWCNRAQSGKSVRQDRLTLRSVRGVGAVKSLAADRWPCHGHRCGLLSESLKGAASAHAETWATLGVVWRVQPVEPNHGKAIIIGRFESEAWLGELLIWITG